MIGSFSYAVDSAVGIDLSRAVVRYFNSRTRKMMSSGFWKYWSTDCLRFFLKFFYLSFASLCLAVVPKTALKSSTSPLKFRIYDVYAGWLKFLPRPPRPL